ncbi:MAG: peptidase S41 [Gammaproteobacteria bacterium 28-57-27]|nr:MAG: peptidase S41 [Gammaproteobacteria bacterium 28-57-27]
MQHRMRAAALVVAGATLGFGLTFGVGVFAQKDTGATNASAESDALPLDELRTFTEVYGRIKDDYVETTEDKKLLTQAIRGMLSGLDPHSSYLDPEEFKELRQGTTGTFGGLGIEVGMEDGFVKVIAPIDDTPAQRAGLKSGDLIIKLDEKPVQGMSINDAVKIMRGEPGTKIKLTVARKGVNKPLEFVLERAIIRVQSVKSRMLAPGFAYVRITQFQSQTEQQMLKAIEALKEEAGGKLKGLVLDLRNNPGGVLQGSVGVADAFLNDGLVVYTDGRVKDSKMRYSAHNGDVLDGAPMVVLVNGGSASASEIVAGALQDQKRAIIMGSKTFGKGSVQSIQELANGGAIKLTTARYFTPSGRSIQAEGIVPDIELPALKVDAIEDNGLGMKESDLTGHLDNPNGKNGKADAPKPDAKVEDADANKTDKPEDKPVSTRSGDAVMDKDDKRPLAQKDYALFEALNMLKGMAIVNKTVSKP